MRLSSIVRFWHTIRYLRPVQLYGRVLFKHARPRPDLAPAPPFRHRGASWQMPARRAQSLTENGRFLFLGVSGSLEDVGWDGSQREKLWRYNQHYFDDLNAINANEREEWHRYLLVDWVRKNRPGRGNAWEPYPTSLRIVNWVKWAQSGHDLPGSCIDCLAIQARWLMVRLETHLLGNHLFSNAKALVFAGLFFAGPEADYWLKKGLHILKREVPEQILKDGGHFERSTMYHALALEDVLDLCNIASCYPTVFSGNYDIHFKEWQQIIPKMWSWLHIMCHPDGEIGFFNDAALGITPSIEELDRYAERLGYTPPDISDSGMMHLGESGYMRLSSNSAVALLDLAPVGPNYLLGHAHADTLSFELSLFAQRVIVNGGTSQYGDGDKRLRERQTRSHSTVEVGGESSSEVWGGFRVARRAYPFGLAVSKSSDMTSVICSHNGYKRLPSKPVHRREWCLSNNSLTIKDKVTGKLPAVARLVLHPNVKIESCNEGTWILKLSGEQHLTITSIYGNSYIEPSHYAPEFGKVLETKCIAVDLINGQAEMLLKWS